MAKNGMKRPEISGGRAQSKAETVPELQGKAKHSKEKARPIIPGTSGANMKVFHTDTPLSKDALDPFDTALARENLTNDLPAADLENL